MYACVLSITYICLYTLALFKRLPRFNAESKTSVKEINALAYIQGNMVDHFPHARVGFECETELHM